MSKVRVAVPSTGEGGIDGERSGHFGHCSVFTIFDIEDKVITKVSTIPNVEHQEGGCLVPVNLLADHQVNALIVGGMGMRPLMGFNQVGITVYHEGESQKIKPVIDKYLTGSLKIMAADQACGGGNH
jgi:predicted Fe-Mo cluster-binding NifX family protein